MSLTAQTIMSSSSMLPVIDIADTQPIRTPIQALSNILISPVDASGSTSIRPWSIPLHLHKDDMQAKLAPIGWLRPTVRAFLEYHYPVNELGEPFILVSICKPLRQLGAEGNVPEDGPEFAYFSEEALGEEYKGLIARMDTLVRWLRAKGMWEECLGGWREEKYEIYADYRSAYFKGDGQGKGASSSKAMWVHLSDLMQQEVIINRIPFPHWHLQQ